MFERDFPNGVVVAEPSFRDRVILKLIALGDGDIPLSPYDEQTIVMGEKYAVGPGDVACQIIADRDEATSEMIWEQKRGEL